MLIALIVQRLILDKTDQKILTLLARNGRMSYRNIANRMGLTTKSVKLRVDKMISAKVIKGFVACANPSIVGYKAMYIVILKEAKLSKDLIDKINLVGHIHSRHRVLGGGIGYGIAVKSGSEDKIELLLQSLQPAIVAVDRFDYSPASYELSSTDYSIIRELIAHPRMEILEIARTISISPKTIQKRLERLEKSRILEFTILPNPSAMKGQIVFFLAVKVERGLCNRVLEIIYSELQEYFILPSITSFKDLIGLTLVSEDAYTMESIRTRIESVKGVLEARIFLAIEVDLYQEWIAKEIERRLVHRKGTEKLPQINVYETS